MFVCIAIKPALFSIGATLEAVTVRLGRFKPCAMPKSKRGMRHSHRPGISGTRATESAYNRKANIIIALEGNLADSLPTCVEVMAVKSPVMEIKRPVIKGVASNLSETRIIKYTRKTPYSSR
jgi:hypothetical protein